MPDAKKLEDLVARLNADPKLMSAFMKDPHGLLKKEGLSLDPAAAKALEDSVKKATNRVARVSKNMVLVW